MTPDPDPHWLDAAILIAALAFFVTFATIATLWGLS